jgi:membrane-bound ClpP family serine protease
MSLEPPKDQHDKEVMEEAQEEAHSFIGKWGTTLTRCNPAGRAMIDNKMANVTAENGWIDEGCEIEVCDSHGSVLVIRIRQENQ